MIEKELNKTTKSIDISKELSRTLSKKIESNDARMKMLKLSVN